MWHLQGSPLLPRNWEFLMNLSGGYYRKTHPRIQVLRCEKPNMKPTADHSHHLEWCWGWFMTLAGWWFGTWLLFLHILGIIIPTDFHIFQGGSNHQPDWNVTDLTSEKVLISLIVHHVQGHVYRNFGGIQAGWGPHYLSCFSLIFMTGWQSIELFFKFMLFSTKAHRNGSFLKRWYP